MTLRWLMGTVGYYRRLFTMIGSGDGSCHLLPRPTACAECRYFWKDAHR